MVEPVYITGGELDKIGRVDVPTFRISGHPEQLVTPMDRLGYIDLAAEAMAKEIDLPGPVDEISRLNKALEGPDYQWWKLNRVGQKVWGDGQEIIEDGAVVPTAANILGLVTKPFLGLLKGLRAGKEKAKKEAREYISKIWKKTELENLRGRQLFASLTNSQRSNYVNGLLPGLRSEYGYGP